MSAAFASADFNKVKSAKTIQLELAGGGALGAYQCGALEILVPFWTSKGFRIASGTGVSAGAVNIAIISYLVNTGQEEKVSKVLGGFWEKNAALGDFYLSPLLAFNCAAQAFNPFHPAEDCAPNLPRSILPYIRMSAATGLPLQKLGDLLQKHIPAPGWKAIQEGPMKTVIRAVEFCPDGRRKKAEFANEDINPQTIMASAALRDFGAYHIGSKRYEDGGYDQIGFHLKEEPCDVLFAIGLRPLKNPQEREDRRGIKTGQIYYDLAEFHQDPDRKCHIDFLCLDHAAHWNDTCAMNNTSENINSLRAQGRRDALAWIARNGADFGTRSSFVPHPDVLRRLQPDAPLPEAA